MRETDVKPLVRDVPPRVVVCLDATNGSTVAIVPAKAVARALGAELVFMHVIEPADGSASHPPDPIEWDLRRREAEAYMAKLAGKHRDNGKVTTSILEGRCAEQICKCLTETRDVGVFLRKDDEAGAHIGDTARRVLEAGTNSLLMVPATMAPQQQASYSRIIVPLDGSPTSEIAIPYAIKIAESEDAEIVLVHATPEPVLTLAGPSEPMDHELRNQLRSRNERVAQRYLDRICAHVRSSGLRARTMIHTGGDTRRQILSSITGKSTDLVVIASHGHSGFIDVPLGDVANFILSRAEVPVLMIRSHLEHRQSHVFGGVRSKGTRIPGATTQ